MSDQVEAVVAIVADESAFIKKRPHPTTPAKTPKIAKIDKSKRAEWTQSIIESLLEIRYSVVSKNKFNSCKTNKQKTAWWKWLTGRLNTRTDLQFDEKQVKNRMTALKAEYRALIQAEKETGNPEDQIKFPLYWDVLSETMQVIIFNVLCERLS